MSPVESGIGGFKKGKFQIMVATDIAARGLDIDDISHVINFDTPDYPENYMHRIGRTGRAEKQGHSLVFATEKEQEALQNIEELMQMKVPLLDLPEEVEISKELIEEERPQINSA